MNFLKLLREVHDDNNENENQQQGQTSTSKPSYPVDPKWVQENAKKVMMESKLKM